MAGGGHLQPVHGFERNVQGRVHADGDIGSEQVVVDGGGHSDHRETHRVERLRAGLRAVAPDGHQSLDARPAHTFNGPGATFGVLELGAAGAAEDGAAQLHDSAHVARAQRLKISRDQAGVAALNPHHFPAALERGPGHGPDGCVHPGRVAAAGQHRNSLHTHFMIYEGPHVTRLVCSRAGTFAPAGAVRIRGARTARPGQC